MRLGVLIIGSLYWDNSTIREEWRCERLEMDAAKHVEVPIRYGRLSSSRGCTYTMVFSMNLVRQNQFGRAIVVPYKRPVNSIKNLIEEAKRLWAAESKKEEINSNFGSEWVGACCASGESGSLHSIRSASRPGLSVSLGNRATDS